MKLTVNWALCEGNGACAVEAPELFDIDDKDQLVVLDDTPSAALREKALAAVQSCPKRALSIEE